MSDPEQRVPFVHGCVRNTGKDPKVLLFGRSSTGTNPVIVNGIQSLHHTIGTAFGRCSNV